MKKLKESEKTKKEVEEVIENFISRREREKERERH